MPPVTSSSTGQQAFMISMHDPIRCARLDSAAWRLPGNDAQRSLSSSARRRRDDNARRRLDDRHFDDHECR